MVALNNSDSPKSQYLIGDIYLNDLKEFDNAIIEYVDGKRVNVPKATRLFVPKGAKLEVIGGGGGGFGDPTKRDINAIKNDLLNEVISIDTVEKYFPQYKTNT